MNQPTNYFKPEELNPHNYPVNVEISANLDDLHDKLNQLRAAYGRPMVITSGLRSDEQQKALIAAGKSTATKSKHLIGQAADIRDEDGKLAAWARQNVEILKDIELWCEDPEYTRGWLHVQTVPPKSGKRFFIP